ncbi:MAG: hypothetical protein SFU86_08020 [Pirellulaceae bacterium]|nr:hypothetical protein [Pirellulaceae bacterium]
MARRQRFPLLVAFPLARRLVTGGIDSAFPIAANNMIYLCVQRISYQSEFLSAKFSLALWSQVVFWQLLAKQAPE